MPTIREIDYDRLMLNLKEMISTLEYDSMRSPGKAKLNSQHLHSMYYLLDVYEKSHSKPSIKPAEVPPIKKVTKKAATKKEQ